MGQLASIFVSQPGMVRRPAYSYTQARRRNTMSKTCNRLPEVSRETVARRWRALLRGHYARNAAKSIMRDFGCEERTANSWLQGETSPQLRNFLRAAELFGISAVIGVLWPDTTEHHRSKLHDDLLELRSRLDVLSRELGGSHHGETEKDRGGNRGPAADGNRESTDRRR